MSAQRDPSEDEEVVRWRTAGAILRHYDLKIEEPRLIKGRNRYLFEMTIGGLTGIGPEMLDAVESILAALTKPAIQA